MHLPCALCMFGASPTGRGTYTKADGIRVHGVVDTEATKPGRVVFSGHVKTTKPDGEEYEGEWRDDKLEGQGGYTSTAASATYVRSHGTTVCAKLVRYKGACKEGLAHGQGVMEYFGTQDKSGAKRASNDDRCIWRFAGTFVHGCPASGTLETGDGETYNAEFDGKAKGGDFAAWYWAPKTDAPRVGGRLVDVPVGSEEYRAVCTEFRKSMLDVVNKIERVENDHLRVLYSVEVDAMRARMQARSGRDKTSAQAVDMWAFHAPGSASVC